jgi:hypothetical protein
VVDLAIQEGGAELAERLEGRVGELLGNMPQPLPQAASAGSLASLASLASLGVFLLGRVSLIRG